MARNTSIGMLVAMRCQDVSFFIGTSAPTLRMQLREESRRTIILRSCLNATFVIPNILAINI
jgi:hypothetical protein